MTPGKTEITTGPEEELVIPYQVQGISYERILTSDKRYPKLCFLLYVFSRVSDLDSDRNGLALLGILAALGGRYCSIYHSTQTRLSFLQGGGSRFKFLRVVLSLQDKNIRKRFCRWYTSTPPEVSSRKMACVRINPVRN